MCGRFQASTSAAEIARWFNTAGPVPNFQQRYNAAPTQNLPVVLRDRESGERTPTHVPGEDSDAHHWNSPRNSVSVRQGSSDVFLHGAGVRSADRDASRCPGWANSGYRGSTQKVPRSVRA